MLHRIDREQGIRRFYSLMIERELVEEHRSELEAGEALKALAEAKRRRGYRDL